jgi:flagellar biosynthesis/type III secretory pathway protein FliH
LSHYFTGYFLPKHLPGEDIRLLDKLEDVEELMNKRAVLWYEQWRQEGKEEGIREGIERGRQEGIQLGRQEGLQLGRQEGIEQGRRQGEIELLLRQLRRRFGSVPETIEVRLRDADPNQLLEWGERAVTANSIDEIFQ